MKYSTVLFDWDGCLVHTFEVWVNAVKKVLLEESLPFSEEEVINTILRSDASVDIASVTDPGLFWDKVRDEVNSNVHKIRLHNGVIEMLTVLKQNKIKTAVVTRASKKLIKNSSADFGIDKFMDLFITREDVKNQKPHSEALLLAMKKLKSTPEETIIIGDSEHEVLAGRAAGIDTVIFYPPHNEAFYNIEDHNALEATYMIRDFGQLPAIIGIVNSS